MHASENKILGTAKKIGRFVGDHTYASAGLQSDEQGKPGIEGKVGMQFGGSNEPEKKADELQIVKVGPRQSSQSGNGASNPAQPSSNYAPYKIAGPVPATVTERNAKADAAIQAQHAAQAALDAKAKAAQTPWYKKFTAPPRSQNVPGMQ